jgi:hypothetical protein
MVPAVDTPQATHESPRESGIPFHRGVRSIDYRNRLYRCWRVRPSASFASDRQPHLYAARQASPPPRRRVALARGFPLLGVPRSLRGRARASHMASPFGREPRVDVCTVEPTAASASRAARCGRLLSGPSQVRPQGSRRDRDHCSTGSRSSHLPNPSRSQTYSLVYFFSPYVIPFNPYLPFNDIHNQKVKRLR